MDKYGAAVHKANNNDNDDNKENCLLPIQFDDNQMLLLPPLLTLSQNIEVLQSLKTKLMSDKNLLT